ncbi:39S ribosomal protein L34, mitochondrial [Hemiscyllium ocellatum]|uniref:39S ribosomal protein L34, mitochondrial n=1 Tax=Hemiscyllium ocellatum TaxID=170820 RepID=UPI0029666C14|nr:39S ribosomal protein L34, mitochondrial [Hemiscyllium ocellatum]
MSFARAVWRGCRWGRVLFLAPVVPSSSSLYKFSSTLLSRPSGLLTLSPSVSQLETGGLSSRLFPWSKGQVRTKKRGTEYQPKVIKRIRTHGWKKRISTRGGIEVILRRMLKGRKSLTY